MSKTKNIAILISASVLLIAIIACVVFFIVNLTRSEDNGLFLSEKENITINIDNKDIAYFENVEFIGQDIDTIKEHFRNVIRINDNEILMKNIKWNSINGDLQLLFNDKKITNLVFSSTFTSANDVYNAFLSINSSFAEKNKLKEHEVQLFDGTSLKNLDSIEELFIETNYLIVTYEINGKTFTMKTNFSNNTYKMTATFN